MTTSHTVCHILFLYSRWFDIVLVGWPKLLCMSIGHILLLKKHNIAYFLKATASHSLDGSTKGCPLVLQSIGPWSCEYWWDGDHRFHSEKEMCRFKLNHFANSLFIVNIVFLIVICESHLSKHIEIHPLSYLSSSGNLQTRPWLCIGYYLQKPNTPILISWNGRVLLQSPDPVLPHVHGMPSDSWPPHRDKTMQISVT